MALGQYTLKKSTAYVTDPASATGIDARDTVNARYTDVTTYIAGAKADLDLAIEDLKTSVGTISVGAVASSGITVPDFSLTVPDFTATFDAAFTTPKPTFTPVFSVPLNKPNTSTAAWQDEVISLEAELVLAVSDWLSSGESAIPAAVQTAIFNAAVLRLDEKKVDSLAEFDSVMAAKAFSCPPGALAIHRARVEGEFAKGSSEISARIAEKDMELTQANKHKAGELAQAYVSAGKQYLIEKNKFMLAALEAAVELWLKEYDAAIKYLEAQVATYKAQVEAYVADGTIYKTDGEVFESQARAYAATIDGLRVKGQLMTDNVRLLIERYKADADIDMKEEELKVDAKKAQYALAERMAEALAGFHSQGVASGMSGIHVSAGISASRSDSLGVSYNWGYSEELSERESEEVSFSASTSTTP